jgi:hypothetical protein
VRYGIEFTDTSLTNSTALEEGAAWIYSMKDNIHMLVLATTAINLLQIPSQVKDFLSR